MITLAMIVRNEAHCIERCLKSVLPLIERAVIVDTGSTDGTQELISDALWDKQHSVIERPWVDFGHNRTELLQLVKQHTPLNSTWALLIDADEEFKPDSLFTMPAPRHDSYYIKHVVPSGHYHRPFLLWMGRDWTYRGVVHEHIVEQHTGPILTDCCVVDHFDSHRNKSQTREQKYLSDAKLLETEFKGPNGTPRDAFYIAESYRWAGDFRQAFHWYIVRMDMTSGCDQERWYAAHMLARLAAETNQDFSVVTHAFRRAHELRPSRAETLVEWAGYLYRKTGDKAGSRQLIAKAMQLPMTTDSLNVDPRCYAER